MLLLTHSQPRIGIGSLLPRVKVPSGFLPGRAKMYPKGSFLRKCFDREFGFGAYDMEAGGPGSGCHGPNCGRPPLPKTTAGVMKMHGWNKVGVDTLHGKPAVVYEHPEHGKITVSLSHFHHTDTAGNTVKYHAGVKGTPLAQQIHEHIKEQEPKEEKKSEAPQPKTDDTAVKELAKDLADQVKETEGKPFGGLPAEVTNGLGETLEWDPKSQGWVNQENGEWYDDIDVSSGLSSGELKQKEVIEKGQTLNKHGLPLNVFNSATFQTYKYDPDKEVYVNVKSLKEIPVSYVKKYFETRSILEIDPKTKEIKLPAGMQKEMTHPSTGQKLTFDPNDGHYKSAATGFPYTAAQLYNITKPVEGEPPKAEVKVEAPKPAEPPEGMHKVYQTSDDLSTLWNAKYTYTWNPATGKYDSSKGGAFTPQDIKDSHAAGGIIPKPAPEDSPVPLPEKPVTPKAAQATDPDMPKGPGTMAYKYVEPSGWSYKYNPGTGKWDKYTAAGKPSSQASVPTSKIWQLINNGKASPVEAYPVPKAMPKTVQTNFGNTYKWNYEIGKYTMGGKLPLVKTGGLSQEAVATHLATGQWKAAEGTYRAPKAAPATPSEAPKLGTTAPPGMHPVYEGKTSDSVYEYYKSEPEVVKPFIPSGKIGPQPLPVGLSKTYTTEKLNYSGHSFTYDEKIGAYRRSDNAAVTVPLQKMKDWADKGIAMVEPPKAKLSTGEEVKDKLPKKSTGTVAIVKSAADNADNEFKYSENAGGLGGAHAKYIYKDGAGNDWLFKPATTIGGAASPLMAHADDVTSKVAQMLRPDASVDVRAVKLTVPGQGEVLGSVQKMIPKQFLRGENAQYKDFIDPKNSSKVRDAATLQPWEVKDLQREQVIDWLLSNHDAHGGQFLRTSSQYPTGRHVIGIDKTQAFKFFGNDKLSVDYHPNTVEKPPYYNEMWKAVQQGKLSFNPNEALETIKNAEAIDDKKYKEMLMPYAASRFGNDSTAANKFLNDAVDRKNNLRADFEQFYGQLTKNPSFKFNEQQVSTDEIGTHQKPDTMGVVSPHHEKPDPPTPWKQTYETHHEMLRTELPNVFAKYGGVTATKAQFDTSHLASWNKALGGSGDTYSLGTNAMKGAAFTKEQLIAAAEGKGVYAEMGARMGLGPRELLDVYHTIGKWQGTTGSGEGPNKIRPAAQEVVQPEKCCSSPFTQALQLEHEITQYKLKQIYPSGMMEVYRGLSGNVAGALKIEASANEYVEYATLGAEGWSTAKSIASSFGGSGVVLKSKVPIDWVITSTETSHAPWSAISSEKELIVAFPGKKALFKSKLEVAHAIYSSADDQGNDNPLKMKFKKVDMTEEADDQPTALPKDARPLPPGSPITIITLTPVDEWGYEL